MNRLVPSIFRCRDNDRTTATASSSANIEEPRKDEYSPWNIFDSLIKQSTSSGITPLAKAIKEVDMYLADNILPRKNEKEEWNDPLQWWKNHRHVGISQFAKNIYQKL